MRTNTHIGSQWTDTIEPQFKKRSNDQRVLDHVLNRVLYELFASDLTLFGGNVWNLRVYCIPYVFMKPLIVRGMLSTNNGLTVVSCRRVVTDRKHLR